MAAQMEPDDEIIQTPMPDHGQNQKVTAAISPDNVFSG